MASDAPEARAGLAHLTTLVTRVAEAGRLCVSVPLAVTMIHAAGSGVTLTLINTPLEARDPKLATVMREAILAAVLTGEKTRSANAHREKAHDVDGAERAATRAVGMRAVLRDTEDVLSPGERQLMAEWLDRIAQTAADAKVRAPKRGRGR